jgi:probable rRNA maturation factor
MPREIEISNRHPRLRLKRRELVDALRHLDARFAFTPADLATLSASGRARARAQVGASSPNSGPDAPRPSAAPAGELSVSFLTDPALARLHADFLADPSTTDVITFEGDESLGHVGDVCVSVDTAIAYAKRHRLSFSEELARYVIHGWLHLAGYDDLAPAKKRRMRAAENRALKLLRDAGLMPAFSLKSAPPRARSRASRSRAS